MNKILKNILAGIYTLLVVLGLITIGIYHMHNPIFRTIYFILLITFTVCFCFILREEEDEELRNN